MPAWKKLPRPECLRFLNGEQPPDGVLWGRSPCRGIVRFRPGSMEFNYMTLHASHDKSLCRSALENIYRQALGPVTPPHPACLADFLIGYNLMDRIEALLAEHPVATSYVIHLVESSDLDVDLKSRVRAAKRMAHAVYNERRQEELR